MKKVEAELEAHRQDASQREATVDRQLHSLDKSLEILDARTKEVQR